MPNQEVTRNEVIALRASVQVLLEQTERMLAKMDKKTVRRQGLTEEAKAKLIANRMKTFMRSASK